MKLPLTVSLLLVFLSTDGLARTYQPIPAIIETQSLVSTPDGLYRETPPVLMSGSEITAEYRASRIWQQYNSTFYQISVQPSVMQVKTVRDEDDDSNALADDYWTERQRKREHFQYHAYRHMDESLYQHSTASNIFSELF